MLNRPLNLECVSYHAVMRYVQRVLDITVAQPQTLRDDAMRRNLILAKMHCEAAGMTIDQVRRLIMTPAVSLGVCQGISKVYMPDFVAVIEDGVIKTVVERKKPKMRVRTLSRSELHRESKRHHRQLKRRPSKCR